MINENENSAIHKIYTFIHTMNISSCDVLQERNVKKVNKNIFYEKKKGKKN